MKALNGEGPSAQKGWKPYIFLSGVHLPLDAPVFLRAIAICRIGQDVIARNPRAKHASSAACAMRLFSGEGLIAQPAKLPNTHAPPGARRSARPTDPRRQRGSSFRRSVVPLVGFATPLRALAAATLRSTRSLTGKPASCWATRKRLAP